MWPAEAPDIYCWRKDGRRPVRRKPLVTWDVVAEKCHWGLILLIGGGFALADSIQVHFITFYLSCHSLSSCFRLVKEL